jgi:hypothetical protein
VAIDNISWRGDCGWLVLVQATQNAPFSPSPFTLTPHHTKHGVENEAPLFFLSPLSPFYGVYIYTLYNTLKRGEKGE